VETGIYNSTKNPTPEGIANLSKHNFVTQTRKVDVGIDYEVAPTSQAQITPHCDNNRVNKSNEDIVAIVQECTEALRLELQFIFASLDVVNFVDLGEALSEDLEIIDASSDMQMVVHDAPIVTPLEDVDLAPVHMSKLVTTRLARLTSDKLPSNQTMIPAFKPLSAATLMSVQILSKLWGDEVEEDNVEAIISNFEQHYPSLSESTNAEKRRSM